MNQKEQIERKYEKKLIFNGLLYLICFAFTVGLIQHATFFYTFPPDMDKWVNVNPMAYLILTVLLFTSFKLSHYLSEKGEIVGDGK